MPANAVELEGLIKNYGQHQALNNLSLQVGQNEIYGLLGPNGAGKSTTIRIMLSLIKPTAGTVRILGKSLMEQRREVLQNVGCIIEKPDFYLYLSAWRNLEICARMSMTNPTAKKLNEMFELVGLKGREHDAVKTYSHGMKQRLGIAQALIHNPALVILDEPTTGLDPQGIIDLRYLILRLKNEMGKTVILSSHILSEMELIADSMAIINKGKVVTQGRVSQLLTNHDLTVYIEPANPQQLMAALSQSPWAAYIQGQEGPETILRLAKDQIPELNNFIEAAGIKVYSLYYRRRLEDYFLKLTAA